MPSLHPYIIGANFFLSISCPSHWNVDYAISWYILWYRKFCLGPSHQNIIGSRLFFVISCPIWNVDSAISLDRLCMAQNLFAPPSP